VESGMELWIWFMKDQIISGWFLGLGVWFSSSRMIGFAASWKWEGCVGNWICVLAAWPHPLPSSCRSELPIYTIYNNHPSHDKWCWWESKGAKPIMSSWLFHHGPHFRLICILCDWQGFLGGCGLERTIPPCRAARILCPDQVLFYCCMY